VSVRNCESLWAHFPSPASRVNAHRAPEEWRRGRQSDWRKSCPLVTLSTQSPTRISLWLDSDLGPDILLPYVGKCSWNYFHKHSQIRLRPERRVFIWFKVIYLYSITRFFSRYSACLRAGRSRDRIPVGTRFSAPDQTGPEAHPASCTMGTRSYAGLRCGRSVTLNPYSLPAPRSKIE
jgi:hypothetical protein